MREIKFRVWDSKLNKFTNGYEDRNNFDEFYSDPPGLFFAGIKNIQKDYNQKRFIIQQYTGLKDKNGIEIYEGDIVSYPSRVLFSENRERSSIIYQSGYFGLSNFRFDDCQAQPLGFSTSNLLGSLSFNYQCEVVGNVMENPELLK